MTKSPTSRLLGISALFLLAACPSGDELSGRYEAKSPDGGSVQLEFGNGHKVAMTMHPPGGGAEDRTEASYLIDGNQVTVQVPGGMPLVLARNGRRLQANRLGEILVFKKRGD